MIRRPHRDSRAPVILTLHAEGLPNDAIAARTNCTKANICQTLKRYGRKANLKPKRVVTPRQKRPREKRAAPRPGTKSERIYRLLTQTALTRPQIAERTGTSEGHIWQVIRNYPAASKRPIDATPAKR